MSIDPSMALTACGLGIDGEIVADGHRNLV
jgi:hypothetical protein